MEGSVVADSEQKKGSQNFFMPVSFLSIRLVSPEGYPQRITSTNAEAI